MVFFFWITHLRTRNYLNRQVETSQELSSIFMCDELKREIPIGSAATERIYTSGSVVKTYDFDPSTAEFKFRLDGNSRL